MLNLTRLVSEPVLRPFPEQAWEARAVFNAAATLRGGLVHLLYRGLNHSVHLNDTLPAQGHKYVSAIGLAQSADGLHFERRAEPVLSGEGPQEDWGVEDPRVTEINGRYHLLYTAFGGRNWGDFRIARAVSSDLIHWQKEGIVLPEANKDAALFPELFAGQYLLIHRREPSMWLSASTDLHHWTDHRVLMAPRPDSWEELKIGLGPPPIRIDAGWLVIYHGVDRQHVYRLGLAILDGQDPSRVLYRHPEPILSPELPWEREGLVPNVVFSCGLVDRGDAYYVYYGGADTVIGVAALAKADLAGLG